LFNGNNFATSAALAEVCALLSAILVQLCYATGILRLRLLLLLLLQVAPVIENYVRQPDVVRLHVQPFHSSEVIRLPRQPDVVPRLNTDRFTHNNHHGIASNRFTEKAVPRHWVISPSPYSLPSRFI